MERDISYYALTERTRSSCCFLLKFHELLSFCETSGTKMIRASRELFPSHDGISWRLSLLMFTCRTTNSMMPTESKKDTSAYLD